MKRSLYVVLLPDGKVVKKWLLYPPRDVPGYAFKSEDGEWHFVALGPLGDVMVDDIFGAMTAKCRLP